MKPRRGRRFRPDPGGVDEPPEGLLHDGVEQPLALQGDEETQILGPWLELIAQHRVLTESLHAARVQWHQS